MNELLTKITAKQRMDMLMKGLSPVNPEHIKKYLSGNGPSLQEKQERVKELFGDTPQNLGSGREVDTVPPVGEYNEKSIAKSEAKSRNPKQILNEEMTGYTSNIGKTISADDLLSFKKTEPKPVSKTSISQEGYENAKNYINAFVKTIQGQSIKDSYNLRLQLFKALKVCLESEGKYKNNQGALAEYRKGVLKAEETFLNNLQ